jgi:DNA-entry nuclease
MRADAKARGRQDFDAECDKITGWGHNAKVRIPSANGTKDYNGYMFNRSHLIADSLGGDPIRANLVTGTRCQNVGNNDNAGGMAYAEEIARNYLDTHRGGWIYYAATPVYVGDEMVPRSVYVDIKSDDCSIDAHIEVFNVANGYAIDYMTGEFEAI